MNKYQNALDIAILNSCSNCLRFDCEKDKLKKIHCDCPFQECIDLLQELVDKETPKKVILHTSEITNPFYTCPKCRMLLSNDIYCPKCGQRLDLEVKDE